LKTIYTADR